MPSRDYREEVKDSGYPLHEPNRRTREIMAALHGKIEGGESVFWGVLGWGNRRAGTEFYGEGGRWNKRRSPDRAGQPEPLGDLLVDVIRGTLGYDSEGSQVVVVVLKPRDAARPEDESDE